MSFCRNAYCLNVGGGSHFSPPFKRVRGWDRELGTPCSMVPLKIFLRRHSKSGKASRKSPDFIPDDKSSFIIFLVRRPVQVAKKDKITAFMLLKEISELLLLLETAIPFGHPPFGRSWE